MMTPTALITGASGGIGEAFARVFAANGYNLALVARTAEKLQALAEELKHLRVTVLPADLTRMEEIDRLYDQLKEKGIHVDVLVNNAGMGAFGPFHENDWQRESGTIDLNIKALAYLTRLFVPHMIRKGKGKILNVASTAAFQPGPGMAVYFASKAFVLSFSEAIATELEGTGVKVTVLCPGPTESGFKDAASMQRSRLFRNRKVPTSIEVAQYGFDALMRGKLIAIHGLAGKAMATAIRFTPRPIVRRIAKWLTGPA